MDKFKSFLYLDVRKLNSLASQLFEGVSDSIVSRTMLVDNHTEVQRGPFGSGNTLSNFLVSGRDLSESKHLHDHMYNMFEENLISNNRVSVLNNDNSVDNITPLMLVKATGQAVFNDSKMLLKSIEEFNGLGEAISFATVYSNLDLIDSGKTRSKQAIAQAAKEYALKNNLHIDNEFINRMKFILNFGINDMLEIRINTPSGIVSSVLDRSYLKENEQLLINKFSRRTEAQVTMFGYVTQTKDYVPRNSVTQSSDETSSQNMKDVFHGMVDAMIDVENNFIGKSIGEVIVDPIAVYVEI